MKPDPEDVVLNHLHDDVERKKIRRRQAKTMRTLLSDVLARHGYAQMRGADRIRNLFKQAVGPQLARACRVGRITKGVLQIVVRDSVVLQELSLQRDKILRTIGQEAPEVNIAGLRFRIGAID